MALPRKRELAAYRLLLEAGELNLGEAVDLLSRRLCTTKRTARRIIKRLRRIGALEITVEGGAVRVRPLPPMDFLDRIIGGYVEARSKRCGGEDGRTHRGR